MSEQNKAFEFIKNYKELIATIVFFIGGFLWMIGYFATKEELNKLNDFILKENKKVQCLLARNVQLIDGEMKSRAYQDESLRLEVEIRQLQPEGAAPQSSFETIIKLTQKKQELDRNISAAVDKKNQAENALYYNRECDK